VTFFENLDQMEPSQIPNDREHEFFPYDRLEFGEKKFLCRVSAPITTRASQFRNACYLLLNDTVSILIVNLNCLVIRANERSESMRSCFSFLADKGEIFDFLDWRWSDTGFRVMVTRNADNTNSFFCCGMKPEGPFPSDYQWTCVINRRVNHVNHELQQWKS
jgi:hypothetical protein